eukprot:178745_1
MSTTSSVAATIFCFIMNLATHSVNADYFDLPQYDCSNAGSNYEFGYCIGEKTQNQIQTRWNEWTMVRDLYEWIQRNQTGKQIYDMFLQNNQNKFASFIEEGHGMADGASFDFDKIFIMTCADELSYFAPSNARYPPTQACSDYMMQQFGSNGLIRSFIAHNEDNRSPNRNNTFLVKANITEEIPFYSYGYAGEILTQSAGWNEFIIFTSNFVHPLNPVPGGLCRNFIARSIMTQTSLQDALKVSAMDGQCAGHNYQIGEWSTGNVSGSEVAYHALHQFTVITSELQWLFHANMYVHLNISQVSSTSSVARENTAHALGKPASLDDMLDYLGNTVNASYPIYKDGQENDYTLHTLSVDLLAKRIVIYADNPKKRNVLYHCGLLLCE